MAVSSAQCLQPQINVSQPSLSVATKVFSGLKLQSASPFGGAKPNITTEFDGKVHKSLQASIENELSSLGRTLMKSLAIKFWPQYYILTALKLPKKLYMYINGPGGDSLQSPVATHCVGCAYNLAAFLLAAGEKVNTSICIGNRSAMPLSRIALQPPSGAARGQIIKDMNRMKRFTAQQALDYGLIDRIVRPPRIKADAPRKDPESENFLKSKRLICNFHSFRIYYCVHFDQISYMKHIKNGSHYIKLF
ncbi:ATP-dependent Clp protease proteolytic subunit-related protein 2, chloroplastic, partial [Cucurbita argyrosperma subsp. argyrosperma]